MNDEELFDLIKRVHPLAVRIPPGIKAIAEAIEAPLRDRITLLEAAMKPLATPIISPSKKKITQTS